MKDSFSSEKIATINAFLDKEDDTEEDDYNVTASVFLVRLFPMEDESSSNLEDWTNENTEENLQHYTDDDSLS